MNFHEMRTPCCVDVAREKRTSPPFDLAATFSAAYEMAGRKADEVFFAALAGVEPNEQEQRGFHGVSMYASDIDRWRAESVRRDEILRDFRAKCVADFIDSIDSEARHEDR